MFVKMTLSEKQNSLLEWIFRRCKEEHHFLESLLCEGFTGVSRMEEDDLDKWLDLACLIDSEWFEANFPKKSS